MTSCSWRQTRIDFSNISGLIWWKTRRKCSTKTSKAIFEINFIFNYFFKPKKIQNSMSLPCLFVRISIKLRLEIKINWKLCHENICAACESFLSIVPGSEKANQKLLCWHVIREIVIITLSFSGLSSFNGVRRSTPDSRSRFVENNFRSWQWHSRADFTADRKILIKFNVASSITIPTIFATKKDWSQASIDPKQMTIVFLGSVNFNDVKVSRIFQMLDLFCPMEIEILNAFFGAEIWEKRQIGIISWADFFTSIHKKLCVYFNGSITSQMLFDLSLFKNCCSGSLRFQILNF